MSIRKQFLKTRPVCKVTFKLPKNIEKQDYINRKEKQMWHCLWPEQAFEDVPIIAITNGIHVPTWVDPKLKLLYDRYLGTTWQDDNDNPSVWELVENIPDQELWQTHYWLKIKLIHAIRERCRKQWVTEHASPSLLFSGGAMLDPSILTIGFARRFATYKRADLILFDLNRSSGCSMNIGDPYRLSLQVRRTRYN